MLIGYEIFIFLENKGFLEIFFYVNKFVMFFFCMMGILLLNIGNKNYFYVLYGLM